MMLKSVMSKRLLLKNKNMKYVSLNIRRVVVVVVPVVVHQLRQQAKVHQKHHQARDHQKNLSEKNLQLNQSHLMKTMMMMMTMMKKMKSK
jgi:tmRNA-binding protein